MRLGCCLAPCGCPCLTGPRARRSCALCWPLKVRPQVRCFSFIVRSRQRRPVSPSGARLRSMARVRTGAQGATHRWSRSWQMHAMRRRNRLLSDSLLRREGFAQQQKVSSSPRTEAETTSSRLHGSRLEGAGVHHAVHALRHVKGVPPVVVRDCVGCART